jgi:mRNA interferase MazF
MFRGEVWLLTLDPTVGAEIRKSRPAVIVNDDDIGILPLKVIVPITDWNDRFFDFVWMTRLQPDAENGLSKVSAADAFQVRSVSEERFVRRLGRISQNDLDQISEAMALVLKLAETKSF